VLVLTICSRHSDREHLVQLHRRARDRYRPGYVNRLLLGECLGNYVIKHTFVTDRYLALQQTVLGRQPITSRWRSSTQLPQLHVDCHSIKSQITQKTTWALQTSTITTEKH
jgi:hypothetical protein